MSMKSVLHLAMICPGSSVRLVSILGGRCIRKRLADLGMNTGDILSVVQSDPCGPMILKVKESRLAIGRGVAHRILVESLDVQDE